MSDASDRSGSTASRFALAARWEALADAYRPGDTFLAFPGGTWLGQGQLDDPAMPCQGLGATGLVQDVARRLASAREQTGIANPVMMGAVPFDSRRDARLFVPRRCWQAPAPAATMPRPGPAAPALALSQVDVPAAPVYEAAVTEALARLARGDLRKVVLARALDVTLHAAPDPAALLRRLVGANPQGYTFAVGLDEPGSGAPADVLLGASPELLVRRCGSRIVVNPLAGSAARHADPARDADAARQLAASAKDAREHALVIDAVVAALRPYCRDLDVPAGPSLIATDALWHLSTTLTGELADPATTSLALALALHPTPAVCGWPVAPAFDTLQALEPFDRGFFAGFVGWCDAAGDGEWAVTLRCARWRGEHLRLFAGAGIVPGSQPVAERAETGTKFRTLLSALGLATALD